MAPHPEMKSQVEYTVFFELHEEDAATFRLLPLGCCYITSYEGILSTRFMRFSVLRSLLCMSNNLFATHKIPVIDQQDHL